MARRTDDENRHGGAYSGVQIRLMGDDPEAVRAAARLLEQALGTAVSLTGESRNRECGGIRVFGAIDPAKANAAS